ncbi:hypothetical protein K449DRAFT_435774 [Hypoxylon sp. EC38]|nr:hypothetical protein K449DRAFT_435774 [Hypoxylon sp. EC38]
MRSHARRFMRVTPARSTPAWTCQCRFSCSLIHFGTFCLLAVEGTVQILIPSEDNLPDRLVGNLEKAQELVCGPKDSLGLHQCFQLGAKWGPGYLAALVAGQVRSEDRVINSYKTRPTLPHHHIPASHSTWDRKEVAICMPYYH